MAATRVRTSNHPRAVPVIQTGLRIPTTLHAKVARAAKRQGLSINDFALRALSAAVEASRPRRPKAKR